MKQFSTNSRSQMNSSKLEERLKQALAKRDKVEKDYKDKNQKYWTILFIDVTYSAKPIFELGENVANTVFDLYQKMVRGVLKQTGCCFVEPGGGPQIVCCYDDPAQAVLAADAVQRTMREWNKDQDEVLRIQPAIGIHQGYIVYKDDLIHQSNTNNFAKRVQTEAKPGQIFVSSHIAETLEQDKGIEFIFSHTANLKNIPEPQDIFEAVVKTPISFSEAVAKEELEVHSEPTETTPLEKVSHQWVMVYIDVCESTKKFWSYGDREASELIRQYQVLCHEMFKDNGSCFVQSCEGDQIVATYDFENVDGAAVAAINIMQGLFRRNVSLPQHKQVRAAIGIHMGEVLFEGEELITTKDMRVGKSIQSLANADEILLSKQVFDLFCPAIRQQMETWGTQEFAGLPDEYFIYSVKWFRAPSKISSYRKPTAGPKKPRRTLY